MTDAEGRRGDGASPITATSPISARARKDSGSSTNEALLFSIQGVDSSSDSVDEEDDDSDKIDGDNDSLGLTGAEG